MEKLRFIMSLRKSHDAFRREMVIGRNEMPNYQKFLSDLGFAELIYQVITAAVMYPRSIDACKDCVQDLSHSLYQSVGKTRLAYGEQERLTHLVDLVGNEIITTLEPHGFYGKSSDPPWVHYDDVTGIPDIWRISESTFSVTVKEHIDSDGHNELSNKSFGSFQTSHWSH